MRRLVVGVIGHVDHGKTALVRALTGMETDRLQEEKARGISIALGFAHLRVGETIIDLIDMPGHEHFVRTMIAGATGLDAVLLVVAANESASAQTTEHVDIAGLLGLRRAIVAVTKADLVSDEAAQRVADDFAALLRRAGLEIYGSVLTSAVGRRGLDDLRNAFSALAETQDDRALDGVAYLPIDRAFSVAGHGSVVTGTLRGALVSVDDTLQLFPSQREVRVRSVQVHGERLESAAPGQRVALNLRGVELAALKRGMALATPGALAPSEWLTISLRAVEDAPPLKNGARLRALLGADEIGVRLRLLDRDVLEPGEQAFAQLRCDEPVAIPAREHVVLRLTSPARTIAGGRILDPEAQRLRRKSEAMFERLERLRDLAAERVLIAEVEHAGLSGVALRRLSRLSATSLPRVVEVLRAAQVVVTQSGVAVSRAGFDDLERRLPDMLASHREGLSRETLAAQLPTVGADVLAAALDELVRRGGLVLRGGAYLLPRPDEDRARAATESELARSIARILENARFTPPDASEFVTDVQAKRALDRLLREGVVVRALDRTKDRELYFHQSAVEEAQRQLAPLLERVPGLLVSEVGAALGISRKYSMPLLDHLDTIRFTRRIKDRRILGSAATVR